MSQNRKDVMKDPAEQIFYAAHLARDAVQALREIDAWCDEAARFDFHVQYAIDGKKVVEFSNDSFGNCFIPQSFVESALRKRALDLPNIDVRFDTAFVSYIASESSVVVTDNYGNEIELDALFACDGASSAVRSCAAPKVIFNG